MRRIFKNEELFPAAITLVYQNERTYSHHLSTDNRTTKSKNTEKP